MKKQHLILCVDDEKNVLNSLKRNLHSAGYRVLLALSGAEALEILDNEDVDLILCDQRMPEMSGVEVLKIAKDKHPDVMRLMLSGYSDFDSLVKTINEGELYRFISKPWDERELQSVIKTALEQKEISCSIKNMLNNVENVAKIIKQFDVKIRSEDNTVVLKVTSSKSILDTSIINQLFENIFKALGFEESEKYNVFSNFIFKDKECVKFEIYIGQGVKLVVEIEMKDFDF